MTEDASEKPKQWRWPPLISIAALIGLGAYVATNGVTSLSPLASLALVGAGGLVVAYTMRHVRRSFDNALTAAIHGVALFLSGVAWVAYLSMIVEARSGGDLLQRFETLVRSKTGQDLLINLGPALTVASLVLTLIGVVLALAIFVYADTFGSKRNQAR